MKTLAIIVLVVVILICGLFFFATLASGNGDKIDHPDAEDELKVIEHTRVRKPYMENDEFDYGHDIKSK